MASQRIDRLAGHVLARNDVEASGDTITITDNRNGKSYKLAISNNTIKATDLKQVKDLNGAPLKTFDPGYMNTTCCISRISFIDGDKGILRYRGIPIEQLAASSNYLECAYLLNYGQLPDKKQYEMWSTSIMEHVHVSEDLVRMHSTFRYDAHPMGMITAAFAALGTLYPEQNPALAGQDIYKSAEVRNKQIARVIGAGPTLAAMAYRHRLGRPMIPPNENLGYTENFLYMLDVLNEGPNYRPHPTLVKAMDVLLLLHAEHELNCSTSAMRHLASSNVDVYTAIAGACGALYGPRHGGANEAVLRMLDSIGHVSKVDEFIAKVKNKKAKLMGFGHRVYKSYDPRAKVVRKILDDVFSLTGPDPLIDVAMQLEKIALSDDYFKSKKLYPNVDFYSGLIYKAMGIPTDVFTVLFTIPRLAGWLAHWSEWVVDPENRIYRPFQVYKGEVLKDYEPMASRKPSDTEPKIARSAINRRRDVTLGKVKPEYSRILHGQDN
mmetsp:Transcript_16477/g.40766  ORF Transcript_16477/g.40766 Transcript_16477/m.40766 type:complete len:494 (+) Transcript_16477:169-1650(+)|eukprot:CAMPEP_0179003156 /NCGR_PEP_ID=MMETSP0795-20121207/12485_1 /TAXON_ID=88552 /ORGANISM="Amoebophrya sp., Strain Ameob2" /LENGTH=493 /DNA_ID=CAMNT_0020697061 /DNA_START=96 /DNA_END=1577 /DNA_ORIENTATION=+